MTKTKTKALAAKNGAISGRMPPVAVEYDANGKRETKDFDDALKAKSFYVGKHKAGKNPTVKGELAEQVTVSEQASPDAEKPQADGKPAKPPKATKAEAARDGFGSRLGSQAAQINACITAKPKAVDAIAKETGFAAGRIKLSRIG